MLKSLLWKTVRLLFAAPQGVKPPLTVRRILVMRYGFLGDVLQTTPLLRFLHETFPAAAIDYWVSAAAAPAIEDNPCIAAVIDADRYGGRFGKLRSTVRGVRHLRRQRYDLAVCLSASPAVGLLGRLAGIPFLVGIASSEEKGIFLHRAVVAPPDDPTPRQRRYNEVALLLEKSAETIDALPLELHWNECDERAARELLGDGAGNYIALFPGGGENTQYRPWAERKWPADRWAETAKRLLEIAPLATIVLLGRGGDAAAATAIERSLPATKVRNLVNRTSFRHLGPVLKKCSLLISNDTAPVFIASAVGCPSVVLYGPEWPSRARPLAGAWTPVAVETGCREQCASFSRPDRCDGSCLRNLSVNSVMEKVLERINASSIL